MKKVLFLRYKGYFYWIPFSLVFLVSALYGHGYFFNSAQNFGYIGGLLL